MMPRHLRTLIAVSLLLGLAGCTTNAVVPTAAVTLSASSAKLVYARGEPIKIVLNLKNATSADVLLGAMTQGTVSIDSLTRDGLAVDRTDSVVKLEDELGYQMKTSAKKVKPGDSLTLTWRSEHDPDQNGHTLQTVVYQPSRPNFSTDYLVGLPGKYQLTVRYQFPRTADPAGDVFSGPVAPASVSFTVSP